ncbi:MAG: type II 3-dehydroquinate dehydratase [Deltaproteobacteria bacterium]
MEENTDSRNILVIHGPNLNMLGLREPDIYGNQTLDEHLELHMETFQSNHEGDIVDKIQQAHGSFQGIIINPAAYTHTSIAIRDALSVLHIPVVEVHLSNIYKRESFRRTSMISAVVTAQISGLGSRGYLLALDGLAQML